MTHNHAGQLKVIDIFAGDDILEIRKRLQANLTQYDVLVNHSSIQLINKTSKRKITMVVKVKAKSGN